ncbi:hypothetical protein KDL45_11105 [bacterium]|nr:hypothetical protein [bacterium]
MATTKLKQQLDHLVDGFDILSEDHVQDFSVNLLLNLSIGVEAGDWSENEYPESFARARALLQKHKAWYLDQPYFMRSVQVIREDFPRDHWWWYIEQV